MIRTAQLLQKRKLSTVQLKVKPAIRNNSSWFSKNLMDKNLPSYVRAINDKGTHIDAKVNEMSISIQPYFLGQKTFTSHNRNNWILSKAYTIDYKIRTTKETIEELSKSFNSMNHYDEMVFSLKCGLYYSQWACDNAWKTMHGSKYLFITDNKTVTDYWFCKNTNWKLTYDQCVDGKVALFHIHARLPKSQLDV